MNGVSVNIKLTPETDKFRFQVCPEEFYDKFEYEIKKLQLKVRYVSLGSGTRQGIAAEIQKRPAQYPFVRTQFLQVPLHKGRFEIAVSEPFGKNVPIDLVLAMVDVKAMYGDFKKDPFYFNRNHLEEVSFTLDNVSIPGEPLKFQSSSEYEEEETASSLSGQPK